MIYLTAGQHPIDQPDISGIVPLSTPNYQTQQSSTIRFQSQSATSMLMGGGARQPLQAVWGPRQSSEPPVRAMRPPLPSQPQPQTLQSDRSLSMLAQSPTTQRPTQQIPAMWQSAPSPGAQSFITQTDMSRSYTSAQSPGATESVITEDMPVFRPQPQQVRQTPPPMAGWQPVQSPSAQPIQQNIAPQQAHQPAFTPVQQAPAQFKPVPVWQPTKPAQQPQTWQPGYVLKAK